jgi:hypothetical protein
MSVTVSVIYQNKTLKTASGRLSGDKFKMIPNIKNVPAKRIAIEIIKGTSGAVGDGLQAIKCEPAVTNKKAIPVIANQAVSANVKTRTASRCRQDAKTKIDIATAIVDSRLPLNHPPQQTDDRHDAPVVTGFSFELTCGKPVAARSRAGGDVGVDMKRGCVNPSRAQMDS